MTKEMVAERFGPVTYTIGSGCSGGSLVQQQVANAYPGVYQGITPQCSFTDAWTMVEAFVTLRSPGAAQVDLQMAWWLLPLTAVHAISATGLVQRALPRIPEPILSIGYGLAAAAALLFVPLAQRPFIYFQF